MGRVMTFLAALSLAPVGTWASLRTVYIDPVSANAPISWWNNVSFATTNASATLVDAQTNSTGIRLQIVTPLQGPNTVASASPTGDAAEFAPAGANSAYGNTNVWSGKVIPFGLAVFSNLTASAAYTFTFYASRTGVSDNREALYTVTGANSGSNTLNAAGNSSRVAVVSNITPRADGTISLRLERGANNNEANGFFYLTAMKVTYEQGAPALPDPRTQVYVDAAGTNAAAGWNLVSFNALTNAALFDATGGVTAIQLQVTKAVNPTLTATASAAPAGDAAEFAGAGIESAYGANGAASNAVAQLTGLSTNTAYAFTFYASRTGVSDNREALYTVTGANSGSAALNASTNSTRVALVTNIYPAADGSVTLRAEKGPLNDNASGYFYLTAFKLAYLPPAQPPAEAPARKRLLFFGNSFSQVDDVPGHVGSLAALAGHPAPLVVADLMSGTDLAYHIGQVDAYPANNVTNAALSGTNTWDHVIIQGYSTESTHLRDTTAFRTNAAALFQRVRNHASGKGAGAGAVLYQTWARAPGHSYYPLTFPSPASMQTEIRTNYEAAAALVSAAEPAADVRLALVGDAFERDGFSPADLYAADLYHAANLGTRLAALVLYKAIYGAAVTNIPYAVVRGAGWTAMSSNDWTRATYWAEGLTPPAETVVTNVPASPRLGARDVFLIDAANGDASSLPGWNAVAFNALGASSLVKTNGFESDVVCTVLTRMNAVNANGTAAPGGAAAVFAPAGPNNAYGNVYPFGAYSNAYALARLSGLSPARRYTFTFFASRIGATDNRETLYTVTGATAGAATLNAADNVASVATVSEIAPLPDGTIDLRIEPGPHNTSTSKFYHLTALKIESVRKGLLIMITH